MTDRARPGLVALYDILPENGAGPFLQPRSAHGVQLNNEKIQQTNTIINTLRPGLYGEGPLATVSLPPQRSLSSQSLGN